ncbi:uncharacterized protein DUF2493 [Hephaestia caeni]|uniref:Uncharacterized protein DUF2493 n=1 Tax=Hephaestia caeni TaxID=645617 RepID=A0A397PB96_9SPHN|nr:DUF2493 domain-containing protein [Hephaestia caeni]RIA46228.1 uncharacterized protein DUF2493 [Hephaestia caeni]
MANTNKGRFSSFADFGEAYAEMTSAKAFSASFTETVIESRLSIMDDPTEEPMPDPELARGCVEDIVSNIFRLLAGTRMESYAQPIAWGLVNSLYYVAKRTERQEDDAATELGDMVRTFDPSEVYQSRLEELTQRCQSLAEARAALECFVDHGANVYHVETGRPFNTIKGTRVSTGLTASQIDGIDYLKAREAAKIEKHYPSRPAVLVSGGGDWEDVDMIYARLDMVRERIPHMVLFTGKRFKGAEQISTCWAEDRGVPIVGFSLNKRAINDFQAAYRRNKVWNGLDEIVEAMIFQQSKVQQDLARLLRARGVPLHIFRLAEQNAGQGPTKVSDLRAEAKRSAA